MKQILYFSLGAASGALIAWYLTKRKYEAIIDEEIAEVKEAYKDDSGAYDYTNDKKTYRANVRNLDYISNEPKIKPVPMNEDLLDENGVIDEVERELEVTNEFPGEKSRIPYVIGPDAYFNELSNVFDKETTTYYAGNDTLVTESEEVLMIPDTIGRESLDHFGEYEEGTLFVRNERLGMDFEVVYSEGSYEPD